MPTEVWRSANTLPRELSLKEINGKVYLTSMPVKELDKIVVPFKTASDIKAGNYTITGTKSAATPYRLTLTTNMLADISFTFSNTAGERLAAGYDKVKNEYFIDRSHAGQSDFNKEFATKHTAPRLSQNQNIKLTLVMDNASLELFADDGLSVMTDIFFPKSLLNQVSVKSDDDLIIKSLKVDKLNSIWK